MKDLTRKGLKLSLVLTLLVSPALAKSEQLNIEFADGTYEPPLDAVYTEDGFKFSVPVGNHTDTGPMGADVFGITPFLVYGWHNGGGNAVVDNVVILEYCGATFDFVGLDIAPDPFNQNPDLPPFTIDLVSSLGTITVAGQTPASIDVSWTGISSIAMVLNDDPTCTVDACRHNGVIDNVRVVPTDDDTDDDGIMDRLDNCAEHSNPLQQDTDGDGYGNACDADLNNDGIVNFGDLALLKAVFVPNPYDADADFNSDGFINFSDLAFMKSTFFNGAKPGPGPSCTVP